MKKFSLVSIATALVGVLCLASSVLTFSVKPAHAADARPLVGSETKDWGSLVDAAGAVEAVTVYGAKLGDFCIPSQSVDVVGMTMTCNVTATNVATVRLQNESGSTADLASSTLRVTVIPYPVTGG